MNTFETNYLYSWEDVSRFKDYALSHPSPYVVLDTETDNKIEKLANLYGVGICFDDSEAFYIPIRKNTGELWWTPEQEEKIAKLIHYLARNKKLLGHNIIYDTLVLLYNWGFDVTPNIYSDTILQKHILDEERPFGLKEVGVKYLGPWADKAQEALYANIEKNGGRTTKENTDMYKADTDVLAEYCCHDVIITKKLFNIFEPRIEKEGLTQLFYKDEIMPLYREVTIPMKRRGFPVDVNYFQELNNNISQEIDNLQVEIQEVVKEITAPFCRQILEKDYPIKQTGSYPKFYAELHGITLPEKNGKVTLAKKEIEARKSEHPFFNWLLTGDTQGLPEESFVRAQEFWYLTDNPDTNYIFNLNSNNHLKHLFFEALGETPLSKTDTGEPQVDDDFLDSMKEKYTWVQKLVDFKKLQKLKSTYIEGILDRQIDGVVYSTFIQFGPPSGRYASRDPNLQNLPRVKDDDAGLSETVLKYVNSIKKGFVPGEGYKIVNADYSQLEPRAFAEACGDKLLQQVYHDKEDLYGSIAKNVWGLDCTANEVKKKYPEMRQKAKVIALAVVYGAESGRISKLMGITYDEAQEIIDDYLNAYEGLKSFMANQNKEVCTKGFVKTKFGRIRHLSQAKEIFDRYGHNIRDSKWAKKKGLGETHWKLKNMLNLAKNFPIQGVAAHVVNRAAIAIENKFKQLGIEGGLVAQVHDELTCIVREDQAEQARKIMKDCMENTTKLSVPLVAEPLIGDNWAESK